MCFLRKTTVREKKKGFFFHFVCLFVLFFVCGGESFCREENLFLTQVMYD